MDDQPDLSLRNSAYQHIPYDSIKNHIHYSTPLQGVPGFQAGVVDERAIFPVTTQIYLSGEKNGI
jgi:hypothetical protein